MQGANENLKEFYPCLRLVSPIVPDISERLTEAEARNRTREILMPYPTTTVLIEKTDESGRGN